MVKEQNMGEFVDWFLLKKTKINGMLVQEKRWN